MGGIGNASLILGVATSAWENVNDPRLNASVKIGRTSATLGFAALPGVDILYGFAELIAPRQTNAAIDSTIRGLGDLGGQAIWSGIGLFGKTQQFEVWSSSPNPWDF